MFEVGSLVLVIEMFVFVNSHSIDLARLKQHNHKHFSKIDSFHIQIVFEWLCISVSFPSVNGGEVAAQIESSTVIVSEIVESLPQLILHNLKLWKLIWLVRQNLRPVV